MSVNIYTEPLTVAFPVAKAPFSRIKFRNKGKGKLFACWKYVAETLRVCFIGSSPGTLNEPHLPGKFPVSEIRPNTPLDYLVWIEFEFNFRVPETFCSYYHEILRKGLPMDVSPSHFHPTERPMNRLLFTS